MKRLDDWALPNPPQVEPPSPSQLTGGLGAEPWLETAAMQRLDSDSPLDRCVAVGLMGRLWSPTSKDAAAAARQRSLSGTGPGQDGRVWWLSLSEPVRGAVVRDALLRADDLADALDELMHAVAEDPLKARSSLLAWLHERDDLASLAFLARATESGQALLVALEQLDETASTHHSMWAFVPGFRDERLLAVAHRDIDAWWGRLVAI